MRALAPVLAAWIRRASRADPVQALPLLAQPLGKRSGQEEEALTISPVLFLIFNRPEPTARVFEAIRRARPPRLYIAADGPRDRPGEAMLCERARAIAMNVDWPCEVFTRFRPANGGCKVAVSEAIDWFFAQVEQGIILEDDCLPSTSFFGFCDEMLDHYAGEPSVMSISGSNASPAHAANAESYYFSRQFRCWGWATWRRAWAHYDREMTGWPRARRDRMLARWSDGDPAFVRFWTRVFDRVSRDLVDSWANRFTFSCWQAGGLACVPFRNLVTNIGFGADATHTREPDHFKANMPAAELNWPLVHPKKIERNRAADAITQAREYPNPPRRLRTDIRDLMRTARRRLQQIGGKPS